MRKLKKVVSLILALALSLALALPATAAEDKVPEVRYYTLEELNFSVQPIGVAHISRNITGESEGVQEFKNAFVFDQDCVIRLKNSLTYKDSFMYSVYYDDNGDCIGLVMEGAPNESEKEFDSFELSVDDYCVYSFGNGVIDDNGYSKTEVCYVVSKAYMDMLTAEGFAVKLESVQPTTPSQSQQPAGTTASPTNDKLEVNGNAADPTVYKIGDSNYFKIRDVAALLNGTEKQFAVGYDGSKNAVTATTGQGYDKQSGDLAGAATGGSQTADPSNDAIYVNGEKIAVEVYKINGSNYFKLRDLGKALDFYVGWSADRGMYIETNKPYSE